MVNKIEEVKKSRWWIWVVVALIIIGVGVYLLFSGPNVSRLPRPPTFPS